MDQGWAALVGAAIGAAATGGTVLASTKLHRRQIRREDYLRLSLSRTCATTVPSQGLLGLGQFGRASLPAAVQGAGDQAVFWLIDIMSPLGALGLRAGAPDGQFGGAQGTLGEAGDFVGRGQGRVVSATGHTTLLARNPRIIHSL
jgi:hypothetical protein